MSVKEQSEKAGLKLKTLRSWHFGSITSWQTDGEKMETVRLNFLGLQNHREW